MEEEDDDDNDDNNLLLKYDNEKEEFHFVEQGVNLKKLKQEERDKVERLKDIEFKNGKLIVREINSITGQRRYFIYILEKKTMI